MYETINSGINISFYISQFQVHGKIKKLLKDNILKQHIKATLIFVV